MKANVKANAAEMVTLPGLGAVRLRFDHENLQVLETAADESIGKVLNDPTSMRRMDAILYAGAWEKADAAGMSFEAFRKSIGRMQGKAYMKATQAAMAAMNAAFADGDVEDPADGDEAPKNE